MYMASEIILARSGSPIAIRAACPQATTHCPTQPDGGVSLRPMQSKQFNMFMSDFARQASQMSRRYSDPNEPMPLRTTQQ